MNNFAGATRIIPLVLLCAVVAACQQSPNDRNAQSESATAGLDSARGTGGMSGMMSTAAMDSMHAHMRLIDTSSAERTKEMLPMHRQMMANMLSQMNAEMRSMNMAADAAWTATADSVRQDLVRMPDMSAAELKAMIPAHQARMMGLMQMHRAMMGKMKS